MTLQPTIQVVKLVNESFDLMIAQLKELIFEEYRQLLHIVVKPRYLFEAEDLQMLDSLYVIIDEKQDMIDTEFFKAHDDYLMKHKIQTEE